MKISNHLISEINSSQIRKDLPKVEVGDNIEVSAKWFDRNNPDKFKINTFKGTVISTKRKNSLSETFTVIKESQRIIIKKVFFANSPLTVSIKKTGEMKKIRRAKLFYHERKLSDKKRRS